MSAAGDTGGRHTVALTAGLTAASAGLVALTGRVRAPAAGKARALAEPRAA